MVTGFGPFNQWDRNPSGEIALALNDTGVGDARVVGMVLPVTFDTSYHHLRDAIERYDPVAVIALNDPDLDDEMVFISFTVPGDAPVVVPVMIVDTGP